MPLADVRVYLRTEAGKSVLALHLTMFSYLSILSDILVTL